MSAYARVDLVEEIAKSSKSILDELQNELDLTNGYLESLRQSEKSINKSAANIKALAARIEAHMKEYRLREHMAVSNELDEIYKQEERK